MGKLKNAKKYEQATVEYLNDQTTTLTYLAKKYGFDRISYSKYLYDNGIEIRSGNKTTDVIRKQEQALTMYKEGMSALQISTELGISRKSFGLYLKETGVEIRDKKIKMKDAYNVDHNYFDRIGTEEQAYWLGFLFADGSVRNDGGSYRLVLELSSVDEAHLDKFKQATKSDVSIKHRKDREMSSLSISSKSIVTKLAEYGCMPNKTDYGFIKDNVITELFTPAFLRGFMDGDGYIDKTRYRIIYTIKSYQIVLGIQKMLSALGLNFKIKDENGKYYRLYTEQKEEYYKFLNAIYHNATVYLDRKYAIYETRIAVFGRDTRDNEREIKREPVKPKGRESEPKVS